MSNREWYLFLDSDGSVAGGGDTEEHPDDIRVIEWSAFDAEQKRADLATKGMSILNQALHESQDREVTLRERIQKLEVK